MDSFPLSRRQAIAAALALFCALLLAGRYLTRAGAPAPARPAAELTPVKAAERQKLVVHVVGAVRRPGLYKLSDGSRVADAVARAGGAGRKADLTLVNLAAPLVDGLQVVVPRRAPPQPAAAAATGGSSAAGDSAAAQGPVHLNAATPEQLDALPGIGPVTAQKILDYRQQHGAFSSVDELDGVPGIGPARLEQLRALVAP